MGFIRVTNLVPWWIFNVSVLSITAWFVTGHFCWTRLQKMAREVGGWLLKGGDYFWIFPSKGGDSSREAINRGTAFIQGNMVWVYYYLPAIIFFVTLDETSSYWICWIFRELGHRGACKKSYQWLQYFIRDV